MAAKQSKADALPDYLVRDGETIAITFDGAGPKIDGTAVKTITMREPTVGDQLAVEGKSAMRAEVAMFANLCDLDPETVSSLSMKHYGRLQEAYGSFLA
ncbi:phage tail assembly protein [Salipiger sp. IMCC34102]|uniref:phage tail assembly protein n=1 Tax=Salipiger sp. IMCC34102 TaxID=2510647 RepID=UPI00101C686F|nr:phage tail assembly protein [Salipiger sp. IMCC34102]RYH04136.1 phage tail assembly protein [Salipiger sp. IMCC34102]